VTEKRKTDKQRKNPYLPPETGEGDMEHLQKITDQRGNRDQGRQKGMKLLSVLILACIVSTVFYMPARAVSDASGTSLKHVLFINSYGYDFETVPVVIKEVSEELKGAASIQYLFMNEKYVSDEAASAQLAVELDSLTAEFSYSAVILGDDAAFDFAIRNRDRYFKNIPLIYEDINSVEKAEQYQDDPLINGVVEAFPMKETIALARTIQKDAARVVVITDNSVSGSGSAQQAMAEQADFPDLKFELFDTSQMTADEIQDRIASYGNETILLYTVFNVDGSGTRYTLAQGVRLITDAARIPVFKADEAGLGDGLTGGYMLSYQSVGRETAALVLAVLNGSTPQSGSVKTDSCRDECDQKMLNRYGISKAILPEDSVYINVDPGFFETYEKPIIIIVCSAAVLFGLILVLSEAHKRKLRRDLELEGRSNRAKTDFISKMSHDIRTPLNAVLGMDRLALNEADHPEKVREYLGKAVASGELLTSLVNDILDLSKIESGKMKLNPSPYRLRDFFSGIRSVFDSMCTEKGIRLIVTENAGGTTVMADHVRLNQLFYNLLTNAAKFTDPGGTIRFTLDSTQQEDVLHCTFAVTDTGCGMSPEFQKHMFDQFAQEGKKDVQGSGLGLAIARSITDLMGGSITVDSTPGKGSTFTVVLNLPVVTIAEAEDDTTESEPDVSALQGKRVLLAEDNEINAQIAKLLLQKVGMTADVAKNGAIAVQMFSEAPRGYYSLILMDNRMPVMTGMETAREIRQLAIPDAAVIPIIALTADAFEDDHQKFIDSGMNDCLTKPIDQKKLIAMLVRYCKGGE